MEKNVPKFGPQVLGDEGVRFRLWAPSAERVDLLLVGPEGGSTPQPMAPVGGGWHDCLIEAARPGQRYRYRVHLYATRSLDVPDPASRFAPQDVLGPSEVTDPQAHAWQDASWRGRPWREAVLYEMHVGTFTPEGTFDAARQRLPLLAALGITALQVMPLAEFGGARGWGYDGVMPFAPESSYGRPEDFKALVDTAHGLGMMVMLDVVYNHFGPEGNFLPAWCPAFFNPNRQTPWGPAINFDGEQSAEVRRFFIENVLYWVEEFHIDGLRLDAVHALGDTSPQHIVEEIVAALAAGPGRERALHLVLENEDNAASRLRAGANPGVAQWNDDFHHAAHVLSTGERESYYADFTERPAELLARALAQGFIYQGQACGSRDGRGRGEPSGQMPPEVFVNFLQTHDQVGNRAFGDRLDALAPAARVEALLACTLLGPAVPMLFMGEEFAASSPFLYFCDFHAELGQQVTQGRRSEFARFEAFRDPVQRERVPDPNAPATFADSKLRWPERDTPAGQRRLALVAELLALRRTRLLPHLPAAGGARYEVDGAAFQVEWPLADGSTWLLRANFGEAGWPRTAGAGEELVYRTGGVATADTAAALEPDAVEVAWRRSAP